MSRMLSLTVCLVTLLNGIGFATADEIPLHVEIDRLLADDVPGPVAELADDATFLRRLSLDLIGRIPTRGELDSFLADSSRDKRRKAVERLIASAEHPRHLATVFDVMLMERRGGKHIKSPEFQAWLERSLRENRSWLAITTNILAADGTDEKQRAASAFYLERGVEPHLLTRDLGRVFFGVDLQCAQCHDHPSIDDYLQRDYHGLHAFVVRASLFRKGKEPAMVAELAEGEADFISVFTGEEGLLRPRLPEGEELREVTLKPADRYKVLPAKNVRPVPQYSRLAQLVKVVDEAPSPAFDRNIANRLWAHMFGRGLVHPVDLHHSGNPPVSPKLLEHLSREFADADYNIQWFLRELALTKAYQRSFFLPALDPSVELAEQQIAEADEAVRQVEQRRVAAEAELENRSEALAAAVEKVEPARKAETEANKSLAEALKKQAAIEGKVAARQKALDAEKSKAGLLESSIEKTTAALKAFDNDAELKQAVEIFQKKQAAQTAAITKLQTTLTSEEDILKKERAAVSAATARADQAIEQRAKLEDQVRNTRQQVLETRLIIQDLRTQAKVAEQRADYFRLLENYREFANSIDEASATGTDNLIVMREELRTRRQAVIEASANRFQVTGLTPLSPEVLARSLMVATGEYERRRSTHAARLAKEEPLPEGVTADDPKFVTRDQEIFEAVEKEIAPILTKFVQLYGAGEGQPQNQFFVTAEQSLFVANSSEIDAWLTPKGDNLTSRLLKKDDPQRLAEDLYRSVLSRPPTPAEVTDVRTMLAEDIPRSDAIRELAWGLLSSVEFRFRH